MLMTLMKKHFFKNMRKEENAHFNTLKKKTLGKHFGTRALRSGAYTPKRACQ